MSSDDDFEEITRFNISSSLSNKDFGQDEIFFSIEVTYSREDIYLSQRKYLHDMLGEIDMS